MPAPTPRKTDVAVVPVEVIERQIYMIRGYKAMLDADVADLYGVKTGNLNLAVRRNAERFPPDFMIQLTEEEFKNLTLQSVSSSATHWGGRRYLPYAFTEHGVAMLSAVLNSKRAVHMSILIVRAFVRLRELVATHQDLAIRIDNLEEIQKTTASVINILADEIGNLKIPPRLPRKRIGFPAEG